MIDKNAKVSAWLFIRAYHRAIANDMSIKELASKLQVSVSYVKCRRKYLSRILGVKFPALQPVTREMEKKELKKMVTSCQHLAERKLQQLKARSAISSQLV